MADQYQIVHLSDIHQGYSGDIALHDEVRNELIFDVGRLRDKLGNADVIVVTGDIAYSGKEEEYKQAGDWLSDLCEAAGCPELSVFVVPGNHDVDWSKITKSVEDQHSNLVNADQVDEHIASRFYDDPDASHILLKKLNNYQAFANRYGRSFESCKSACWIHETSALGSPILCFVGLNTALFSDKHDQKDRLALGPSQYIAPLERRNNVEYIVLMHHPLEWLRDGQLAKDWLESRTRISLMGHEHTFGMKKTEDLQEYERLVVQAAATNPPAEDGYEFRYNWLTLSTCVEGDSCQLAVTVWPRVWLFNNTSFSADYNILQGNEYKDFYLTLPEIVMETTVEEMEMPEENCTMPSFVDSDGEDSSMAEGNQGVTRDDSEFRRLQFLFWKELDRNQRIRVLAELDMLPYDFEAPPVWLRRGLDAARRQGKLQDLWDSVMNCLPDVQQEHNPF
jgi:predicted MPP superfamily phosphohydrolase